MACTPVILLSISEKLLFGPNMKKRVAKNSKDQQ